MHCCVVHRSAVVPVCNGNYDYDYDDKDYDKDYGEDDVDNRDHESTRRNRLRIGSNSRECEQRGTIADRNGNRKQKIEQNGTEQNRPSDCAMT